MGDGKKNEGQKFIPDQISTGGICMEGRLATAHGVRIVISKLKVVIFRDKGRKEMRGNKKCWQIMRGHQNATVMCDLYLIMAKTKREKHPLPHSPFFPSPPSH